MRYIIGLLLGIGLIVLTFILIFRIFSGGGNTPKNQPAPLLDYATTQAVMRYTIDGPVTADQQHSRVRITVSKDQVLYEQIKGYEGTLTKSQVYPSNVQAYGTFLRAIDLAGYAKGDKKIDKDERGYCPLGNRYLYEIFDGADSVQRWWSTSCSNKQGNFLGAPSTIRSLFQKQVVDYSKLTSGTGLN